MEFTLSLNRDLNFGGAISPNTFSFLVTGTPIETEVGKLVKVKYTIAFNGILGITPETERFESITYRSKYIEVPIVILALLADIDNQKETVNNFLSQFTFKGFLEGFVLSIP